MESDGSLSPLPQRATPLAEPATTIFALNGSLAVVGKSAVSLFAVDPATGALSLRDVASLGPIRDAVADASGNTLLITTQNDEVQFQQRDGRLIATTPRMSSARGTMAMLNQSAQQTSPAVLTPAVLTPAVHTPAVLTNDQHFMYVLDPSMAQIKAFRAEGKQTIPLTPAAYPMPKGASALALVSP